MNTTRFRWIVLAAGLALGLASCEEPPTREAKPGQVVLHGAGGTFPAPLYGKWIEELDRTYPDVVVRYDAVGSGEGIKRFLAGTVDFGASDAALSAEQVAQVTRGVHFIPTTAGSIVLAYNLPGLTAPLRLKRDVYVDILLGKLTRWDDPRIAAGNPGVNLPDSTIHVAARLDGSGTTYALTNHLAAISPEWKTSRGVGTKVDWRGASLAEGNEGVAAYVKRTPGSIGYVEFGMAQRTGLAMAWLENKAGRFVEPTGKTGLATLLHAKMLPDTQAFFPDPEGEDSYPIVAYTWLLLYRSSNDSKKAEALRRVVRWCLTDGQQYNEGLGFIRLSPEVAQGGLELMDRIK
jgi:phosphate transport system substrate-binding protein